MRPPRFQARSKTFLIERAASLQAELDALPPLSEELPRDEYLELERRLRVWPKAISCDQNSVIHADDELRSMHEGVIPQRLADVQTDRPVPERGLFLHGPVGTGKTYTAAGIANRAIVEGYKVRWVTMSSWLNQKKDSFNNPSLAPPSVQELTDSDLLVIDDLGAERGTEWATEIIFALVNTAYDNDTLLVVTSNLRFAELDKRLDERIVSRLMEVCDAELVDGPDRRLEAYAARREAAK